MVERTAYFALACFWKPDAQFGCQRGVLRTRVGYCGGTGPAPNYPLLNDHTEVVEVVFDANIVSYETLLSLFWRFHDPCSCSKRQYMSAIFFLDEGQKRAAEKSRKRFEAETGNQVSTKILPMTLFHEAEGYHQKYFLRTYHKSFYSSLPTEEAVTSTRDARLNGFLSGYSNIEELEKEELLQTLSSDQMLYVRRHVTGEVKPSTVMPFLSTVVQVMCSFVKKATGF